MAILKRKPGVTTQGGKPESKTGGGEDDFMSRLKNAQAPASGFDVIPGQYEALMYKADAFNDDKSQRESYFMEFAIVNDDKMYCKTCRTYYTIKTKEGEDGNGYDYLKRDLETLGFEMTAYSTRDEFEQALKKFAEEERPYVVIDVKKNGQYTNVFLNSVMDDQDKKPDMPF